MQIAGTEKIVGKWRTAYLHFMSKKVIMIVEWIRAQNRIHSAIFYIFRKKGTSEMKLNFWRRAAAVFFAGATILSCTTGCEDIEGGSTIMLSAKQFADILYTKVPLSDNLSYQDGSTMGLLMNINGFTDAAGYTANGQIPDMIAVFCGTDTTQAASFETSIHTYLDEMTREYEKYAPEQVEKLENAVVKASGNYAVLCVTPDTKTAKQVITDVLTTGTCTLANLRTLPDENAEPAGTVPSVSEPLVDMTLPQSDTTSSSHIASDTLPLTDTTLLTSATTTTTASASQPGAPVMGTNPIPSGDIPIAAQNDYQDFGAVFRDGDTAYEAFYYNDKYATQYADALNRLAAKVPATVRIFDLLIPTSADITLPDALVGKVNVTSQQNAIAQVNQKLGAAVNSVDIYQTMRSHRGEYIYFRTDHHWTALGSYYAFADYCKAAGKTAPELASCTIKEFPGFLGSFYRDTKEHPKLAANPDTIYAYYPPHFNDIKLQYTDANGVVHDWPLISDVSNYTARLKYSTFAGGDNPKVTTVNNAVTDGSVCILVKESFGNALIPYLADVYQYVYAFDYRYDKRDFAAFVAQFPHADVVFANNLSALQSSYSCGKIAAYIGS